MTRSATVTVTAVSAEFIIGDRVENTANLNVRSTPSTTGIILGTQPTGAQGTIIGGPINADGFTWWQVDFDNPPDGWIAESGLKNVTGTDGGTSGIPPGIGGFAMPDLQNEKNTYTNWSWTWEQSIEPNFSGDPIYTVVTVTKHGKSRR